MLTGEKIISLYDIDGEEFNDDSSIDFQECTYMNIFENIKSSPKSKCENCFKATKEIIGEFFKYSDCNKDGFISAENLWNGM